MRTRARFKIVYIYRLSYDARAREAVFCEKVKKNEFAAIFSSVCPKKYHQAEPWVNSYFERLVKDPKAPKSLYKGILFHKCKENGWKTCISRIFFVPLYRI